MSDNVTIEVTADEARLIAKALRSWDGWDTSIRDTIDDDTQRRVLEIARRLG